jgi:hypothetical protein
VTEVTEEARGPADGGGAPVPEWLDFVFCWFLRAGREASLLGGGLGFSVCEPSSNDPYAGSRSDGPES